MRKFQHLFLYFLVVLPLIQGWAAASTEESQAAPESSAPTCDREHANTIANKLTEVRESTGNGDAILSFSTQALTPAAILAEIKEISRQLADSGTTAQLDPQLREKLLNTKDGLLKAYREQVLIPAMEQVERITKKPKLTEEDRKTLNDLLEKNFKQLWPNDDLTKAIQLAATKKDDLYLAEKLKEVTLFAEYYTKMIKDLQARRGDTPKKITVSLEGFTLLGSAVGNSDQSVSGVTKYLLGDSASPVKVRQEGAIGLFRRQSEEAIRKEEIAKQRSEMQEIQKEQIAEHDERIAQGEVFSTALMEKAKAHFAQYRKYYSKMQDECQASLYNQRGCQIAQRNFELYGKKVHLKRMFRYLEMAQKDRDKEKIAAIKRQREEFLGAEGEDGEEGLEGEGEDEAFGHHATLLYGKAETGNPSSAFENLYSNNTIMRSGRLPTGETGFIQPAMNSAQMYSGAMLMPQMQNPNMMLGSPLSNPYMNNPLMVGQMPYTRGLPMMSNSTMMMSAPLMGVVERR